MAFRRAQFISNKNRSEQFFESDDEQSVVPLVFGGVEENPLSTDVPEDVDAGNAVVENDVDDSAGLVRKLLQFQPRRVGELGELQRLRRS